MVGQITKTGDGTNAITGGTNVPPVIQLKYALPQVTPYYCRLGDLLCYTCMLYLSIFVSMHVNFVFSLFFVLFSFVASFSTLILLVGSFDL